MIVNNPKHHIWTERYRVTQLDDFIGNPHLKTFMKNAIDNNVLPNLLFNGPAGTGKTTLAKLLISNLNCDSLYINASKERNLDTVKETITTFASSASFRPLKVVILDEADFMMASAQAALRGVMEEFALKTRFILTCNYLDKIIDPLQSRCQTFKVIPPSKLDVCKHVSKILESEGVSFQLEDLVPIINSKYPDIRQIINILQQSTINKKLDYTNQNNELSNLIITELKNKSKIVGKTLDKL